MNVHMNEAKIIAVWLFILGIYIGAPLVIGHVPIPAFLAGGAGMFLLAVNSGQITRKHVVLLLALGLLGLVGVFINLGDGADTARLKGVMQLLYSVMISGGLFFELSGWRKVRLARLFQVIALLIVVGCFLELHTSFGGWSDSFRSHVFPVGTLYKSEFREQFGEIRPKLFTVEPSYVAIFFLLTMTMWITLVKESFVSVGQYFLLSVAGMYMIASPIVLLIAFIPVLNALFLNENGNNPFKFMLQKKTMKRLFVIFLYSSALFLVMFVIWRGVGTIHIAQTNQQTVTTPERPVVITESRVEQIVHGKDDSVTGRLMAPPLIAYRVLSVAPWFGVGLEAKEKLNGVVFEVFKKLGMQTANVPFNTLGNSITNVFWWHWIYFGMGGGLLMMLWLFKLMKVIGVQYPLYYFVVIVMFMQTMGGYVTPRFWFVSFLIMLLGAIGRNNDDNADGLEYKNDAQK